MDSCVKRCVQTHPFLTANMTHSVFAESKTMETFHPDMNTYVKSCTRTRPHKSKWCRVISWSVVVVSRSSWSVFLIVVVSHGGRSFFLVVVVSLLHDQSFLVEELACRHVGQGKLFFKNAALYVASCVETFFSVKVMGKYEIQT